MIEHLILISSLLLSGGLVATSSFCYVTDGSVTIVCDSMKDTLNFQSGENISINLNSTNSTLIISSIIPTPTTSSLGGVFSGQCDEGDYMVGILQSGGIICQTLP